MGDVLPQKQKPSRVLVTLAISGRDSIKVRAGCSLSVGSNLNMSLNEGRWPPLQERPRFSSSWVSLTTSRVQVDPRCCNSYSSKGNKGR
ncbi:hypothetical protein DSO57_1010847 [Entomophthora muscae]|uniref:Uncharacterized protein n=1 Tax=Entomophthora muscae TaxID=34485 RepID=A0ACC2RXN9_9FUNG|nr:hypothetical protein DSO57_1010847 [Entomophthora muscae]